MFNDIIESIKFFGGITGLLSGAFLIYDRLLRGRPIVYLGAKEFHAHIFFRNSAAETIVIDEVVFEPAFLSIVHANDLITSNEERQQSWYPTTVGKNDPRFEGNYIVLKSNEERDFAIHRLADFEAAADNATVTVRCRWENTRRPWPLARQAKIRTTVGRIKKLREASISRKR